MIVRRLGPDDVAAFRRIRLEALREHPESFASTYEDWLRLTEAELAERLESAPSFAAFAGTEPVGLIGYIREAPSKMAHRATLIMVYLRASHRGGGAARQLLHAALEHAREAGVIQAELAVAAGNTRAQRFYAREGFTEIGTIPGGFRHEGRLIDEVLMVRRLDP